MYNGSFLSGDSGARAGLIMCLSQGLGKEVGGGFRGTRPAIHEPTPANFSLKSPPLPHQLPLHSYGLLLVFLRIKAVLEQGSGVLSPAAQYVRIFMLILRPLTIPRVVPSPVDTQ